MWKASFALLLCHASAASAWCWSCSAHGERAWWVFSGDCQCKDGWEGSCCDVPVTCTNGMDTMCPQHKLVEHKGKCADLDGSGPISVGKAAMGLPPSLQGIFWLTEQGDSSALMSFATSNDGAGLSTLDLSKEFGIEVRVGGDRVWSFHDKATSWGLVAALDLIYKFKFENAAGEAPASADEITAAQIIPEGHNLGISLTATNILNFRAELAPMGSHARYNSSVVWGRPSSVLGFSGGYYDLVQVVDGNGNKVQPAFDDWAMYCNSPTTGGTPGDFFYRVAQ